MHAGYASFEGNVYEQISLIKLLKSLSIGADYADWHNAGNDAMVRRKTSFLIDYRVKLMDLSVDIESFAQDAAPYRSF